MERKTEKEIQREILGGYRREAKKGEQKKRAGERKREKRSRQERKPGNLP